MLVNPDPRRRVDPTAGEVLVNQSASFPSLALSDLTAIRNILRGGSVIDWHRLYFSNRAEVDRFLRINEFDPTSQADMALLESLREQAVEYCERHLSFRVSEDVASRIPARDLLLVASQKGRRRTQSCVVLKVMHVLYHLMGGELATRLSVSADQVFQLVETKVLRTVEEMRAAGCQIAEFEWSRKEQDSLVTKLLAKRENIAAHVYDRLRFRMITHTEEEIVFILRELMQRLVPFNYLIPGESQNDIVDLHQYIETHASLRQYLPDLLDLSKIASDKRVTPVNEFSGPSFRVVNFVADLPIRLDTFLGKPANDPLFADTGPMIFVLTEFQIVDLKTAEANESGENSHERYKDRQIQRVKARLMHGMQEEETPPPEVMNMFGRQDGDLGHD